MTDLMNRRDLIKLAGMGVAVFVSGAAAGASRFAQNRDDSFYFVQLSDTHWGFNGPNINPDAQGTLKKAVAAVNALDEQPDFVVFTGDLTQTTDDRKIRRDRMAEFRDIVSELRVKDVRFMPGEHDASLDRGDAYQEFFGDLHYTFDHKGVHFITLDNVSDPTAAVGEKQLQWLQADLKQVGNDARIVVLTHRPLFDLAPDWDWATRDGAAVIDVLLRHPNVTVLYGHIHQEHHHMTGHIAHHAARSLMWALPEPGSVPKKAQVPWNPDEPYKGLGFREVEAQAAQAKYQIKEFPISRSSARAMDEQVVRVSASNFQFKPSEIVVRKDVPVTFELTSQDRHHGFKLPEFHVRADIQPGVVEKVRFIPDKVGVFAFVCDVFCGDGHEEMSGTLRVIQP